MEFAIEIEVLETSLRRKKYDNPIENPNRDVIKREAQMKVSNDSNIEYTSSIFTFIKEITISIGIDRKFLAKFIPVGV